MPRITRTTPAQSASRNDAAKTKPDVDLDAAYINAEHAAGENAEEEALAHYLNAGQRLNEKRATMQAQAGGERYFGWEEWMKHLDCTAPTARRYMRFAELVGAKTVFAPGELAELWASTRWSPDEEQPKPQESQPDGMEQEQSADRPSEVFVNRLKECEASMVQEGTLGESGTAERLETTPKTIRRGMEALQRMGLPVEPMKVDVDGVWESGWKWQLDTPASPLFVSSLPQHIREIVEVEMAKQKQ